ncbi:MAG: MFS transporter, partial [Anaerolineae bacterium]|nr:MFS transporter [Anaerolineae bacterium]
PRRVGVQHAANAVGFQVAGAGTGLALMPAFAGVLAQQINLEIILPIVFFAYVLMFVLFQLSLSYSARSASTVPAAEGI